MRQWWASRAVAAVVCCLSCSGCAAVYGAASSIHFPGEDRPAGGQLRKDGRTQDEAFWGGFIPLAVLDAGYTGLGAYEVHRTSNAGSALLLTSGVLALVLDALIAADRLSR